ncbi:MAG TPA: hypothetical protein VN258_14395 [Mobilitalea sp.]|nr:hypothetical protein [Mobilitalea sp.]
MSTIIDKNHWMMTKKRIAFYVLAALLILAALLANLHGRASAAETSISVKEINYYNSTITLQLNSGDTAVYFSDSTKKKWELVPGQISNGTITMDISWISASKNYTMYFKGDYSTLEISVTLVKQVTNFSASFNILKATVTFNNAENRTLEWRKKGSSTWKTLNTSTMAAELGYYYENGAQVCFRLAPVNGTSSTDAGLRPSNEVTVTVPKKTAAPAITINGSKFSIAVKKGISYRKMNSDGTYTSWTDITSATDLLLSSIAPEALYSSNAGSQKEVTLQFRTNAGSTSQVSNITTVKVPVQKAAPNTDTYGISLNYTSSSTLSLIVKAASTTAPFEYTIILKDKTLNYQTATWKTISSSTAVSISSTAAPTGSRIYVRMKSIEASATVSFSLASVETDISGVNGIEYPNASQATQLTTLVTTAGVCCTGTSSSYLAFYLYSPTSTTVSSIDFYDAFGIKKGAVTCKSSVALNSKSTGASDKYIITTMITSTGEIDFVTGETLYAYITLANQEVIKSTASTGVLLYLYKATILNNPDDTSYTANFKRIYKSIDSKDASSFKFRLDLGTDKVIDPSGINKFTSEATAISSLIYNGYTLSKGTDYTVEYGSYVNDDKDTIVTATVTVNVSVMEKSASIKADQALPLIIYLNNNEILDSSVSITMISTATIDNTPIAWSITEGSLKEKTTSTVTNSDGTTTTTSNDVITYTISLTLFSDTYEVSVANVTWGDASIFGSATISKGKATISLSNAKINKLTTDSTDTKNIVITLSNGYVIESGCKLTILNAN